MRIYLKWVLLGAVALGILFLAIKSYQVVQQKEKFATDKGQLPNFQGCLNSDSSHFEISSLPQQKPVIVLFLDTECGQCQRQVANLQQHYQRLQNAEVLLVSVERLAALRAFEQKVKSNQHFHLLQIQFEQVFETFGSLISPHTFVYDTNHQLLKDFKGQTPIDSIVGALSVQ